MKKLPTDQEEDNHTLVNLPSAFIACEPHTFIVQEKVTTSEIISAAKSMLTHQLKKSSVVLNSSTLVKEYVFLALAAEESEIFCVVFLDSRFRLISFEKLFSGTICESTVYPRSIAKRALELNASSIMLVHNHPSGLCEPSHQDRELTSRIQSAFVLIDVNVIDHLIVGNNTVYSFAEHGLL